MPENVQSLHTVIICTLNRTSSLSRLFDNLLSCKIGNNLQLVVIDSSENFENQKLISEFLSSSFHESSTVAYEKGGLPASRNRAFEFINFDKTNLVHFFDDDISIANSYFSETEKFFDLNPKIGGAGPRISSLYSDNVKSESKIKNFFTKYLELSEVSNFGRLTISGKNFWFPDLENLQPYSADWIPGCCMIFRSNILQEFKFNSNLEKGPGKNYALGEDVDFTWRVSRKYKLAVMPNVRVIHHLERSKRDNKLLMQKANSVWIGYLSFLAYERVKPFKALFSLVMPEIHKIFLESKFIFFGALRFVRLPFILIYQISIVSMKVIYFSRGRFSRKLRLRRSR